MTMRVLLFVGAGVVLVVAILLIVMVANAMTGGRNCVMPAGTSTHRRTRRPATPEKGSTAPDLRPLTVTDG